MSALRSLSVVLVVAALVSTGTLGCKKKVSQQQCDTLIDAFATLVVKERTKDAAPEVIKAEQERERQEARGDEAFRNCTSEIGPADFDCAMKSATSEAFLKCLE